MLKYGTQAIVAVTGLAALALSTGCGAEGAKQVRQAISEVKSSARIACVDRDRPWHAEGPTQNERECEYGIEVGARMARSVLAKSFAVRVENGERVFETRIEPVRVYVEGAKDRFVGIDAYCVSELYADSGATGAMAYAPSTREIANCRKGAKALFVALGKKCGLDIESMKAVESAACVLHREPFTPEEPVPYLPPAVEYDCKVAGGRQCP